MYTNIDSIDLNDIEKLNRNDVPNNIYILLNDMINIDEYIYEIENRLLYSLIDYKIIQNGYESIGNCIIKAINKGTRRGYITIENKSYIKIKNNIYVDKNNDIIIKLFDKIINYAIEMYNNFININ